MYSQIAPFCFTLYTGDIWCNVSVEKEKYNVPEVFADVRCLSTDVQVYEVII